MDPPALFASGELYARLVPEPGQGRWAAAAGGAKSAAFVGGSLALYLNLPATRALARRLGARDGRDLMINSGVLGLESRRPPARTHVLAGLMFALYPLWWRLGWDHGRRARPRAG